MCGVVHKTKPHHLVMYNQKCGNLAGWVLRVDNNSCSTKHRHTYAQMTAPDLVYSSVTWIWRTRCSDQSARWALAEGLATTWFLLGLCLPCRQPSVAPISSLMGWLIIIPMLACDQAASGLASPVTLGQPPSDSTKKNTKAVTFAAQLILNWLVWSAWAGQMRSGLTSLGREIIHFFIGKNLREVSQLGLGPRLSDHCILGIRWCDALA